MGNFEKMIHISSIQQKKELILVDKKIETQLIVCF